MKKYLLIPSLIFASPSQGFQKAEKKAFPGLSYENEKNWKEPFFFIQMADCQLGFIEENRSWDEEIRLLEKAVDQINQLHPKFVILCGDLVHAFPREPMREEQIADFKKIACRIDPAIPLICLCGNHDVGNQPDRSTIAMYENDFGAHYFSFWVGGTQGIVLNSSLIWDPTNAQDLYAEQIDWFQNQLEFDRENPPVHRFVFAHHPWFVKDIEEEDFYFVIPKKRRRKFLDLMKEADVSACFCGHYHRNALADYDGMPVITTSAVGKQLGDDVSGFRIVNVFEDRIEHEYVILEPNKIEDLSPSRLENPRNI